MSIASTPFHRISPQPGMMIDVDTWRESHDYHRDQLSRHHLALHGWGVIEGLNVNLVTGSENTLRIEAGVAIDSAGRFVMVPQAQNYQITARERQTVYLVLQFRDVPLDPSGKVPWRVVEAYRIQERDRLPEEPFLELARVDFDPKAGALKVPKNAKSPGINELDLRSRAELGSVTPAPRLASAPTLVAVADDLAPRVEVLSQQVGALDERIQVLSNDLEAAHQSPALVEPGGDGGHDARLDRLAAQVQHLAERVEGLGSQPDSPEHDSRLKSLADQVQHLAERVGGVGSQPSGPEHDSRLKSLADQVQYLADRVEAFGSQPGATLGEDDSRMQALSERVVSLAQQIEGLGSVVRASSGQPAVQTEPSITAEGVASVVAEQISSVREHVDSVAGRVDGLAQQVTAAEQREGADTEAQAARIDGLRHEVDALGLQMQALSRQVDGLPVAAVMPVSSIASVAVGADRGALRLAVGQHNGAGWDSHRDGLRFLARQLTADSDLAGQNLDPVHLADARGVEVLYLSGHAALSLSESEVDAIAQLLDQGAAVIGEGCAAGSNGEAGAREFAMSFVDLANRLGRQLTRVDRSHPLMQTEHVFGEVPAGARTTARVLEAGGLVYSDADYGCAWQGGPADHALPRATIRDALEFGINLSLFRRNGR